MAYFHTNVVIEIIVINIIIFSVSVHDSEQGGLSAKVYQIILFNLFCNDS